MAGMETRIFRWLKAHRAKLNGHGARREDDINHSLDRHRWTVNTELRNSLEIDDDPPLLVPTKIDR